MGESTKSFCALVLIVTSIAAAVAWGMDRPDAAMWGDRIGGPILGLLALGVILKLQFRRDLAHDYLRQRAGDYFNRGGFCFASDVSAVDGVAHLDVYFQNQRNARCLGRVALRPGEGFFTTRAKMITFTCDIDCGPAAFGVARIAIPIPEKYQGKRQTFEVGASVEYPDGKGRRVRFHDGLYLRANAKFGNAFGTALTAAGAAVAAASGAVVMSKPATVKIDLPRNVSDSVPDGLKPEITTLWKLGDLPLQDNT